MYAMSYVIKFHPVIGLIPVTLHYASMSKEYSIFSNKKNCKHCQSHGAKLQNPVFYSNVLNIIKNFNELLVILCGNYKNTKRVGLHHC